jgi:hypothetical protein
LINVISFSLWGDDPFYWVGARRNIDLARRFYPNWICRFYVDQQAPAALWQRLVDDGAQVFLMRRVGSYDGLFWRFLAAGDARVNIMLSRDCDSRLNWREAAAVTEWLASDRDFHIMRDHPLHGMPILGGLWGCRNGVLSDIPERIARWTSFDTRASDQDFLARVIYPRIVGRAFEHSAFGHSYGSRVHPFPTARRNFEFVGEIFDAEEVRGDAWQGIRDWPRLAAERP